MLSSSSVLSGNEAFWEKTYIENFATLCSRASRRLTNGNPVEAEDAVSEAFARVMRYAPNPDAIKSVVPYLWTVVKRVWTAQQVRLSTTRTEHLEDLDAEEIERIPAVRVEPDIQMVLEKEAFQLELRMTLGPMSLEEKALVDLFLKGFSLDEIASTLGEDVKRTRFRWYKFIARQRYRLSKQQARAQTASR
jgi:RNA polymerase sigma factor (sigma-70 family)